jgi:CRISPR type III-A-associated RAMP protein Csm4
MTPALLVKFQPAGPWRIGPESGSREDVERVLHSDTLFSALTHAMAALGRLEEWLGSTALAPRPQVAVSSLFPYQEQALYVVPPAIVWPPPPSPKLYWSGVRFVPLSVVRPLLEDEALGEDRWLVDIASESLISANKFGRTGGPAVKSLRVTVPVDRPTGRSGEPQPTACLEFRENSGMWGVVTFDDAEACLRWEQPVRAALQFLADEGLGGERSRGWGRTARLDIRSGDLEEMLLPARRKPNPAPGEPADEPAPSAAIGYWLLSLYAPADDDNVDWSQGHYSLVTRSGRTGLQAALTQRIRLVAEGSVIVCPEPPLGSAKNVAPDGHPHPVFRSGLAVALPIPLPVRNP